MRENIYYWKCDNPLPIEEKWVYNDKYTLSDISEVVEDVAVYHFGKKPLEVSATGSAGNHYTYNIVYKDKTIFFRSDDGKMDDNYLIAEKAAIDLAGKNGVLVPEVYITDTSKKNFPVRYQLMEKVVGERMSDFYQDNTLDRIKVGNELGAQLAKMHAIKLDGFGFINTEILQKENRIVGLDKINKDFFYKKLDEHLNYLLASGFLSDVEATNLRKLIEKNEKVLDINQGYMVHKDIAFWNIVGTKDKINAIVDWDDIISGDPADDLAIIRCFYGEDIFNPVIEGYQTITQLSDDFYQRMWLYMIRNMIWKAVFRISMKYFQIDGKINLFNQDKQKSLREFTYNQLYIGINELSKL